MEDACSKVTPDQDHARESDQSINNASDAEAWEIGPTIAVTRVPMDERTGRMRWSRAAGLHAGWIYA